VIGAYGSGKSEYSINLAKSLKLNNNDKVCLVDLDIVNPYFRSRDVRDAFEQIGIEVIAPEFNYGHADVPMISPRVTGSIRDTSKTVILDVGGDPAGCRALARFVDEIVQRTYTMRLVVNTRRPFTTNADEIIEMAGKLEFTSNLKITELVCNTNLMELTEEALIRSGIAIIREVAIAQNLAFETYLVLNDMQNKYPDYLDGIKKMDMAYFLSKPWEKK
jgi:hypothetical protein